MALLLGLFAVISAQADTQSFTATQGNNPIALRVFEPVQEKAGIVPSKTFTLAYLFGPSNEAGLTPAANLQPNKATDLVTIYGGGPNSPQVTAYYNVGVRGTTGWRIVGWGNEDIPDFPFPIQSGVLLDRKGSSAITWSVEGLRWCDPIDISALSGPSVVNLPNRRYITLQDLNIGRFLKPLEDLFGSFAGGGRIYQWTGNGWIDGRTQKAVDPRLEVLTSPLSINIRSDGFVFPVAFPSPQIEPINLLAPEEGAIRKLRGQGFKDLSSICPYIAGKAGKSDTVVLLHPRQIVDDGLIVQVGKVPPDFFGERVVLQNGYGGQIDDFVGGNDLRVEKNGTWFSSGANFSQFQSDLNEPVNEGFRREAEHRAFSQIDQDGETLLVRFPKEKWPDGTLVELEFMMSTKTRKVAFHMPQIRFPGGGARDRVERIGALIADIAVNYELFDQEIEQTIIETNDAMILGLSCEDGPIAMMLNACIQFPPPPAKIASAPSSLFENQVFVIEGSDFGARADDLCVVLTDGAGGTVPVRVLGISEDGTRLTAQVVGPFPNVNNRKIMIAKGRGVTRFFDFAFDDVIQVEASWVWQGVGLKAALSAFNIQPIFAMGEEVCSPGDLSGGRLTNKVSDNWEEVDRVRVSFTCETKNIALDYYAPNLCFTKGGSAEECAQRIRQGIGAAFIQEGMADGDTLNMQIAVSGSTATMDVSVNGPGGGVEPITDGHFNICVLEEANCNIAELNDSDGDRIDDTWEEVRYGDEPALVTVAGDSDSDGYLDRYEFAFGSDPFQNTGGSQFDVFRDLDGDPTITYRRHAAAAHFFNFGIETSTTVGSWELSRAFDMTIAEQLGKDTVNVTLHPKASLKGLANRYFRLKVTPR